jgi:hypothetical protein
VNAIFTATKVFAERGLLRSATARTATAPQAGTRAAHRTDDARCGTDTQERATSNHDRRASTGPAPATRPPFSRLVRHHDHRGGVAVAVVSAALLW